MSDADRTDARGARERATADDGTIPQISLRRAARVTLSRFCLVSECPGPVVSATESRSGPGPSAREQGTRVPPLVVMNSAVKHNACHVGVPGPGSMISVRGPREWRRPDR
jgi:hypothetical protein